VKWNGDLFGGLLGPGGGRRGVIWRRVDESSDHGSRKNHVLCQQGQLLHQWLSPHQRHRSLFLLLNSISIFLWDFGGIGFEDQQIVLMPFAFVRTRKLKKAHFVMGQLQFDIHFGFGIKHSSRCSSGLCFFLFFSFWARSSGPQCQ
jgi:hypothetical protein